MVKAEPTDPLHATLLTMDVAHPPIPPDRVEEILLEACSRVRNSPSLRVLKVVHGYGSSGRGGKTKQVVRNWAFRHRARLRDVIDGERYQLSDAAVQEMINELGRYEDADLWSPNHGITVLWVK